MTKGSSSPSAALSLANSMIVHIQEGLWHSFLPSERALSVQFNVGRKTVRGALSLLEKQEWISSTLLKKKREILKNKGNSLENRKKPYKKICVISSVPIAEMSSGIQGELQRLQEILSKENIIFHTLIIPSALTSISPSYLKSLVEREQADLWILYRTTESTQLWFKEHNIPAFVRGSTFPSANLPQLDQDWPATLKHAIQVLMAYGHKNIALFVPKEHLAGIIQLKATFSTLNYPDWNPLLVSVPSEKKELLSVVEDFRTNHPEITAIITSHTPLLLTLMTWCYKEGVKIPDNLSVVSLHYETYLQYLVPEINHYSIDPEKIARKTVRIIHALLKKQLTKKTQVFFCPDYCPGDSIANLNSKQVKSLPKLQKTPESSLISSFGMEGMPPPKRKRGRPSKASLLIEAKAKKDLGASPFNIS